MNRLAGLLISLLVVFCVGCAVEYQSVDAGDAAEVLFDVSGSNTAVPPGYSFNISLYKDSSMCAIDDFLGLVKLDTKHIKRKIRVSGGERLYIKIEYGTRLSDVKKSVYFSFVAEPEGDYRFPIELRPENKGFLVVGHQKNSGFSFQDWSVCQNEKIYSSQQAGNVLMSIP